MKCEVTLYKAGTVFKEEVIAKDFDDPQITLDDIKKIKTKFNIKE